MHVLLIEDDDLVASGIQAGLADYDIVVDHVATLASARATMRTLSSDVVVLDLGLPDGDGMNLLAEWRAAEVATPVLILTARDAVSDRVAGLRGGADDYLLKPFDLDELVARLQALLRRAAGRMGDDLPPEIAGLAALQRYAEQGGDWPVIDSGDPAYFHAIRATPGPARDLVNRLLSELAPRDVRQLFITHKPLFYRLYQGWPDAKREYVAQMLAREYAIDKQGTRTALFGPEPGMARPDPATRDGPWGRAPAARSDTGSPRPAGPWGRAAEDGS